MLLYNASGSASPSKASTTRTTGEEFQPRLQRAWWDNPERLYSEAERRALVERAVIMLPSKYRVLRDIEQLS
jgi:hypothetical protein